MKKHSKSLFGIKHITDKNCFVFIIPTLIHKTNVNDSCQCHNDQILLKSQVDTISKTSITKSPPPNCTVLIPLTSIPHFLVWLLV